MDQQIQLLNVQESRRISLFGGVGLQETAIATTICLDQPALSAFCAVARDSLALQPARFRIALEPSLNEERAARSVKNKPGFHLPTAVGTERLICHPLRPSSRIRGYVS